MRTSLACLISLAAIAVVAANAPSARARHGGGGADGQEDFHGKDYDHFSHSERGVWRGGRWDHSWHDGRFAWWWIAGGGWYNYPQPIYPFPTYVPPTTVIHQALPAPHGLPPSQFWYFCDNPQGYFPYVAACNGRWREVGAAPAE
jgi:hypothetical protein